MIENRNSTGKTQYINHPEYGVMTRKSMSKYFRPAEDEPDASVKFIELSDVPAELIKNQLLYQRDRQPKYIRCTKCSDKVGADVLYPESEVDMGLCRACLCGYDSPEEKAQLHIDNAHYKIGWSTNLRSKEG